MHIIANRRVIRSQITVSERANFGNHSRSVKCVSGWWSSPHLSVAPAALKYLKTANFIPCAANRYHRVRGVEVNSECGGYCAGRTRISRNRGRVQDYNPILRPAFWTNATTALLDRGWACGSRGKRTVQQSAFARPFATAKPGLLQQSLHCSLVAVLKRIRHTPRCHF